VFAIDHDLSFNPAALFVAVVAIVMALPAESASAGGLFDLLFGNARREPVPAALSYAPPATSTTSIQRTKPMIATKHAMIYCVRLCDGRYFPMQRNATANAVQLCKSFCPASQTKVFSGADVKYSMAADGTRYGSLQNAYLFRTRLVTNCTCNGKNHIGLAPIDPGSDPTLRSGDIVVMSSGKTTITGSRSNHSVAQTVQLSLSR
jgi:hypothetical protein